MARRLLSSCSLMLLGAWSVAAAPPKAHSNNGTYTGLNLKEFNQEAFYGIPFAEPPLDDLRLRHPVSYNQSWKGTRNATVRSLSCPGYDFPFTQGFADGLNMGEDCLTLDIVRPAGTKPGDDLPVFLWIYGGGFKAGGSADPRYNESFIIRNSMEMGKPVMVVIPNYRTMGFGFIAGNEVQKAGQGNIGLFDQRLAMRWVQENIKAFGGDPNGVTIGGESAGGSSVGYQLLGFDGQNDGLFRGAIMESSSLLGAGLWGPGSFDRVYEGWYQNITTTVGCDKSSDSLACLRKVPYKTLYNAMIGFQFKPVVDGTFITQRPHIAIAEGKIADVAIIMGSNTDEGTAEFFTPRGTINNDTDVAKLIAGLGGGLDSDIVSKVMELYPNDPVVGCPFETGPKTWPSQGLQFKRAAAISGDTAIHAGRRFYCARHANVSTKPIYSYRFNQAPWNMKEVDVTTTAPVFVTHFTEIVYVWDNPDKNVNWIGPYVSFHALQKFVSRSWVSFVHDQDPNNHGLSDKPTWPKYDAADPSNIVFTAGASWVEKDNYRAEQLAYWGTIWGPLFS